MARREVVEIVCDRCGKKDLQEKQDLQDAPELEVSFRGEKKTYKDLCLRCREAVRGYFLRMTKQEEETTKAPAAPAPEPDGGKKKGIFG
jgi:hypothetical protein